MKRRLTTISCFDACAQTDKEMMKIEQSDFEENTDDGIVTLTVSADDSGKRADRFLADSFTDRSRSFLQKLIADGCVTLEGKALKASAKLSEGSVVTVQLPPVEELVVEPQDIPLSVLYEDADVLVIDKPKGMVVHPAPGHEKGTVVNAVLYHCRGQLSGINGVQRPGIVHRIDRDTTGSLIICKNDQAHNALAAQLEAHSVDRTYRAICWGRIEDEEGCINAPIGRDIRDRKKMAVSPGGKRAVTHFKVLERFEKLTYIECRLETGRTHQIRVHMAHIGHPILGDAVYGRFKAPAPLPADADEKQLARAESERKARVRKELLQAGITEPVEGFYGQCLHAMRLGFVHPKTGEQIIAEAPLPAYFEKLLACLRETT